jgi:hypothetical protein
MIFKTFYLFILKIRQIICTYNLEQNRQFLHSLVYKTEQTDTILKLLKMLK